MLKYCQIDLALHTSVAKNILKQHKKCNFHLSSFLIKIVHDMLKNLPGFTHDAPGFNQRTLDLSQTPRSANNIPLFETKFPGFKNMVSRYIPQAPGFRISRTLDMVTWP